uniref:Fibronectin type-III domain-containing protein n=1 Tax=Lygus hesperus TaxID=30085 RepID=A0A0A9YCJ3_LYGHE
MATTYPLLDVRVDIVGETFIDLKWARPLCVEHIEQPHDDSNGEVMMLATKSAFDNVSPQGVTGGKNQDDAAYGCYDPAIHVSFPDKTKVHNYMVCIKPYPGEPAFCEADEPLDEYGARVYETTQPTLRFSYLLPGTRYIVNVREQLVDVQNKHIDNGWGAFSRSLCIETVPPLRVLPL